MHRVKVRLPMRAVLHNWNAKRTGACGVIFRLASAPTAHTADLPASSLRRNLDHDAASTMALRTALELAKDHGSAPVSARCKRDAILVYTNSPLATARGATTALHRQRLTTSGHASTITRGAKVRDPFDDCLPRESLDNVRYLSLDLFARLCGGLFCRARDTSKFRTIEPTRFTQALCEKQCGAMQSRVTNVLPVFHSPQQATEFIREGECAQSNLGVGYRFR